jgi:hypothetical protein
MARVYAGTAPRYGSRLCRAEPVLVPQACWRLAVPPVAARAGSLGWISRGACRQVDPDLFVPLAAAASPVVRQVEAAQAVWVGGHFRGTVNAAMAE